MNKTKMIATIGPSSRSKETIKQMILSGVDVIRINMSHSSFEDARDVILKVRELNRELSVITGIMIDTRGPEIRITELEKNKSALDDALSQQRIKQNSLERLKNEKQTYVAQLTSEEKENQQEIEKFEEDKRKIQAELKRIAEEEAKKNTTNISQKPSASGYIFPVQGLSKANINNIFTFL